MQNSLDFMEPQSQLIFIGSQPSTKTSMPSATSSPPKPSPKASSNQDETSLLDPFLVKQALNKKCRQHPTQTCCLINFSIDAKEPRICYTCLGEMKNPNTQFLDINSLLSDDPLRYMNRYPILSNTQTAERVKAVVISMNELEKEVAEFYDQLEIDFKEAIKKSKQQMKIRIDLLQKACYTTLESLADIAQVSVLQNIILYPQKITPDTKLLDFIKDAVYSARKNTQTIEQNIKAYENLKMYYSLTEPEKLKDDIMDILKKLTFFSDFNALPEPSPSQPKKQQLLLQPQFSFISQENYTQSTHIIKEKTSSYLITNIGDHSGAKCVTSIPLKKDVSYIIRVQLLNELIDDQPGFILGLIPKDKSSNQFIQSDSINYFEVTGGDVSTVVKGEKLYSGNINIGTDKKLEIRINLKKKYLRIAEYPYYQDIAQINNSEDIKDKSQYYFQICIIGGRNRVRVFDFLQVENFDNLMD